MRQSAYWVCARNYPIILGVTVLFHLLAVVHVYHGLNVILKLCLFYHFFSVCVSTLLIADGHWCLVWSQKTQCRYGKYPSLFQLPPLPSLPLLSILFCNYLFDVSLITFTFSLLLLFPSVLLEFISVLYCYVSFVFFCTVTKCFLGSRGSSGIRWSLSRNYEILCEFDLAISKRRVVHGSFQCRRGITAHFDEKATLGALSAGSVHCFTADQNHCFIFVTVIYCNCTTLMHDV